MHSEIIQGFQLSPQQKHLWRLQQNSDSKIYRSLCAVDISGNLNLETLNTALKVVVQRHQILRTSFDCLQGMTIPLQVINDVSSSDLLIQTHDLSGIEPHQQQNAIAAIIESAKQHIFDFEQSPLLQVSLATLSPGQHVLLLNLPALCADTTSLNNLVAEISRAYRACLHGEELTDEPVQYILFSEWQNELLQAPEAEIGREYWQKKDISHISSLKLPNENQAVGKTGFHPQVLTRTIHSELVAKISSVATKFKTSESIFLLTCWQILLWRLTRISEMVVGTACDGRTEEELQETLGLLARYLPLHCHLESSFKFGEVLEEVALAQTQAYDWQDCFTWEEVLGVETAITGIPFSPFCFDFTKQSHNLSIPDEVSFTLSQTYIYFDRFKVKLSFVRRDNFLVAEFHYDGNLFSPADIQDLAAQYQTLLESAIQNPQAAIDELNILSKEQRQQLLVDFNKTRIDFPQNKCLHQLFEKQVELTPDEIAVVYEHQQLTYAQLNTRANQLAHHLFSKGVRPEVLVGICMDRSLEMVIALLGVLKAGGAYMPIDPMYPQERVALMVEDAQMPVLLTQQRLLGSLPQYQGQIICLDADWGSIAEESEANPAINVTIDNLAYVIYTSGSTGKPKGAMLPHRAICNHMLWIQAEFSLKSTDKFLQKTPFSFDASVWEFYAPLLVGAQLVMARPGGHQDSDYLIQVIREQKITILQLVPTLLRMLLENKDIGSCTSLKSVFCGGEALPVELQERFFAHLNADLHNLYGPTETCIDATFWTCKGGINQQTIPIGCPIANTQVYILDSLLHPVPIGVSGELHIGGAGLAKGYLNRPELTTDKFIPSPFDSSKKLYKTGDLARYLPDGNIEFLGRIDNQVKIRGFRIELGEIEAVLNTHPQIQQTVVIDTEDIPGNKRLVAYLVTSDKSLTTNQLREFLFSKLPEYMVPSVFVSLDRLPLTPNGKVDLQALLSFPQVKQESEETFVTARDELECKLTKIWEKILKIKPIGIKDNFFNLGGHSLQAVRLFAEIKKVISKDFPLATLFQAPTIEQLANILRQNGWSSSWSSLVAIQPSGSKRPFFFHGGAADAVTWARFASLLGREQPFYALQRPDLDGKEIIQNSVEEMAALCIKEIRTIQPDGPYLLGGHCFGGTVVFEMAQQLHKQGEKVALLALVDTFAPKSMPNTLSFYFQFQNLFDQVDFWLHKTYYYHLANLDFGKLKDKLTYVWERIKFKAEQKVSYQQFKSQQIPNTKNTNIKEPLPHNLRYLLAEEISYETKINYIPQVYPGKITIFRASKQIGEWYYGPQLGWEDLADEEIEINEIPGLAGNLFNQSSAPLLAEKLKSYLDNLQVDNYAY